MKHMEGNESNKKTLKIIVIIILTFIVLASGAYLGYRFYTDIERKKTSSNDVVRAENNEQITIQDKVEEKEEKKVKIYSGNERPIAVMIDNSKDALPQGGLNDAYIVYEIIVEGGESRLMAIFKGTTPEKIGPIRSSRHYFLDYALENDAIYAHFGWSPQAEYDIKSLGVNNINGISESSETFWRVKDKKAPHNVATTIEKLKAVAENKKYRMTSDAGSVLKYVTDEVNLDDGISANEITIPYYGKSNTVKYTYNQETKRYQRFSKGVEEKDWSSQEATTTKNIIITFVKNYTLKDSENKGRQGISNINKLEGYYITNGRAIKITCEKTSRKERTIYKKLDGKEINVNDGNTFVQICPIDAEVKIKGTEDETLETIK